MCNGLCDTCVYRMQDYGNVFCYFEGNEDISESYYNETEVKKCGKYVKVMEL